MADKVQIVQQFQNCAPPYGVQRSLRVLLNHVPPEHLKGLKKIVLTDSTEVGSQMKGKYTEGKRRFRASERKGFYYTGHIVLTLDHIFAEHFEVALLLLPPLRTYLLAKVLYHEIGHHIHRLRTPGYRHNKEEFADEWRDKLIAKFFSERYWYLVKLMRILKPRSAN